MNIASVQPKKGGPDIQRIKSHQPLAQKIKNQPGRHSFERSPRILPPLNPETNEAAMKAQVRKLPTEHYGLNPLFADIALPAKPSSLKGSLSLCQKFCTYQSNKFGPGLRKNFTASYYFSRAKHLEVYSHSQKLNPLSPRLAWSDACSAYQES